MNDDERRAARWTRDPSTPPGRIPRSRVAAVPERGSGEGRPTVLLAYPPERRERLYPDVVLERLREVAEVRLLRATMADGSLAWIDEAAEAQVVIADRVIEAPKEAFVRLPELRAFVRGAVDVRTVDRAAAARHAVTVVQGRPVWIDAVCELTLGLTIGLLRGVPDAVQTYRSGRPAEGRMGRQLAGTTLGVVGYGNLGRRMVELGRALRMQVRVSDPNGVDVPPGVPNESLHELLSASDVVVLMAAHTPATEGLVGREALRAMRPHAVLINVGRGGLVDEGALYDALTEERIAGAAMDVGRGPDDLPDLRLASLPNVVATPHVGGLVQEAIHVQALDTVDQVRELVAGRDPVGTLEPPAGSGAATS